MMRKLKTLFLTAAIALLANSVIAQDDEAGEEQIVIDDLSRTELRDEIEKIENEYYRVFNASIDDNRLKITCTTYTPTGSHITRRACEPKFVVDRRNENVNNYQSNTDVLQSPQELRTELNQEFEELTAAMNAVLKENQYFRDLNGILRMLRERMAELDQ